MEIYLYLSRLILVAAFTVATVFSGALHRTPQAPVDESLANYLQAGFSVDDFCGDIPGSGNGSGFCEFCNLIGAALVPNISGPCLVELELVAQVWQSADLTPPALCFDNCHAARAPPVA